MSRLAEYRKLVAAVAALVVEVVAAWQGAPEWALAVAGVAGAVAVWRLPNAGRLPHLTADELLRLAEQQAEREQRQ